MWERTIGGNSKIMKTCTSPIYNSSSSSPGEKNLRATINSILLHYADKLRHFNQNIVNLGICFLFTTAVEENWEPAVQSKSF